VVVNTGAAPEAIEFEHLDVIEDAEPEDSIAKTLGLEDVRDDFHRGGDRMEEADLDDAETEGVAEESDDAE